MFRVRKRQCSTCIYRPDSTLSLAKLEADVADPYLEGHFKGHRICHSSPDGDDVCCRGFWEKHKDNFDAGQLAQRLNCVVFVEETEAAMSNKTAVKRARREARKQFVGMPSAAQIASMHAQNLVEHAANQKRRLEMQRAVDNANARLAKKRKAAAAAPVTLPTKAEHRVELVPEPEGSIQEGSLRAAVVDALRAGRGSMTVEELSRALKQDARPVVAKLVQKGWLREIS